MNLYVFSDDVTALQDIWFIGDDFLRVVYDSLKKLRSTAIIEKRNQPYLYMFFNVHGFFQKKWSAVKGLARILNSFTEALNTKPRLPKYVIIVPEKDLIRDINFFGFGASDVFSAAIIWLATEMETKVRRRTMQLLEKKPGALSIDTPKFIWVKVLKRPYNSLQEFNHIMALRNRFNNALESTLAATKSSIIMDCQLKWKNRIFIWLVI